jgi:hypothetical protein
VALQSSDRLILDGLSILNDPRPNPAQKTLGNGIHLRFGCGAESEFPKHGYHLFRRTVADPGERCVAQFVARVPAGPVAGNALDTPYGRFTSAALTATDLFEPPGVAELDLAGGLRFDLPAGMTTRKWSLRIGFRPPGRVARTIIDFRTRRPGEGPSPRVEQGVRFEFFHGPDRPASASQVKAVGSHVGLGCSRQVIITFPRPARNIDIDFRRGPQDPPITLTTSLGEAVAKPQPLPTTGEVVGWASAGPVTRIVIDAPAEQVPLLLHVDADIEPSTEIALTGFAGTGVVTTTTVRGNPGDIISAELVGGPMTAIQIGAGAASLLDLCYFTCLSQFLVGIPVGPIKGNAVQTPYGTLTAGALTATDDFTPSGTAEISLANAGAQFTLRPGVTARRVTAKIGFRKEATIQANVDFRKLPAGEGPNPRTEQGLRFEVFRVPGTLATATELRAVGEGVGLNCGRQLAIALPPQSSNLHMTLRRRGVDPPFVLKGWTPKGELAFERTVPDDGTIGFGLQANVVVARVVVESPGETFLYHISVDVDAGPAEVLLTAFSGSTEVAATTVRGARGEVVTAELNGAAISSLQLGRGPAALLDLCYTPGSDKGAPWGFVPSFTYPLTLPITHPGYPAAPGAETLTARRAMAAARIRYGTAAEFLPPPKPVPATGTLTLTPGSAIAKGTGTAWTESLVGQLLYPASADTAFAVMTVLAPNRLVLSRPYTGAQPLQNVSYSLAAEDDFAQLHDQLGALLSEPAGMRKASMPPVLEQSTATRRIVLQPIASKPGQFVAKGQGTAWTADIAGLLLEIGSGPGVYRIASVNTATQAIVIQPPYAGAPGAFAYRLLSRSPNNDIEDVPSIDLRPIDLVDLASLHPAYAQALGLYWIDPTAQPGRTYDYMLLADHAGRFNRDGKTALAWLNGTPDFSGTAVDGAQLSGIVHTGAGALAAPTTLQAFALPTGHMRSRPDRPDLGDADAALSIRDLAAWASRPPMMLEVWRASLGANKPLAGAPPAPGNYTSLGDSFLPVKRTTPPDAPRPNGWPDPAEVHYLDAGDDGLDVGWYAYAVVAIDVYGRYSALSQPIPWHATTGTAQLHPYAVHIEDLTPPPPPTDVTVSVLEPDSVTDPMRIEDAAYKAWRASVGPKVVGLRVRWRWPWSHELRAPDLQEFRFYAQSKPLNARFHRLVSVIGAASDPTRSIVKCSGADTLANDAYKGATLQVNERGYAIEESRGGTNLELRVKNGGPTGAVPPAPDADATIVLPFRHPLHCNVLDPKHWERWFGAVAQAGPANATVQFDIDPAEDPDVVLYDDPANRLHGEAADWNQSRVRLDDLPAGAVLTGLRPGIDVIALASDAGAFALLEIASIAPAQKEIVPAAPLPPALPKGNYRWALGARDRGLRGSGAQWRASTRTLDLLPPKIASLRPGVDRIYLRVTPASTPAMVAHYFDIESVDAVKNRLVLSGAVASLTNLQLYEWRVGTPVRTYEAFFPAAKTTDPDTLQLGQWLKASLAEPVVYGTIGVSAADKRTEVPEWHPKRTPPRTGNEGVLASPATVFRVHREPPNAPADGAWDAERLTASKAGYDGKSYFSVRWPAPPASNAPHYKALIFRASSETLFLVDKEQKRTYPLTFTAANDPRPAHWTAARKAKVAAELFAAPVADYTKLSDDALSVLANLSGNDEAFAQITIDPLDLGGAANADRRGPEDPPAYVVHPALKAWLDTLPGRTRVRYLYKVAYVDSAQNRGPMSKASPPVDIPKVVPPRTPVIMKILGGEREVTLHWAANREPDLAGYRIYRTDDDAKATDVRSMELAGTEPPGAQNPKDRVAQVSWSDTGLTGGRTLYYRVSALDTSGNESPLSAPAKMRVVDTAVPDPPLLGIARWVLLDGDIEHPWIKGVPVPSNRTPAIRIEWTSPVHKPTFMVRRRALSEPAAKPLSLVRLEEKALGTFVLYDSDVVAVEFYEYAVRVTSSAGLQSARFGMTAIQPPE